MGIKLKLSSEHPSSQSAKVKEEKGSSRGHGAQAAEEEANQASGKLCFPGAHPPGRAGRGAGVRAWCAEVPRNQAGLATAPTDSC